VKSSTDTAIIMDESTDNQYEVAMDSSTLINESIISLTNNAIETRSTIETAMEVDEAATIYIGSCDSTVSFCYYYLFFIHKILMRLVGVF
jgi:hypothetical protein